jgi:hypothetical protein
MTTTALDGFTPRMYGTFPSWLQPVREGVGPSWPAPAKSGQRSLPVIGNSRGEACTIAMLSESTR